MPKKSKKEMEELVEKINKGFSEFDKAIKTFETQAHKGLMPLLGNAFHLCGEILEMYRKAWEAEVNEHNDE